MPLILPLLFEVAAPSATPAIVAPPARVEAPAPTRARAPLPDARSPGPEAEPSPSGQSTRVFGEIFARYSHEKWAEQRVRAFDLPRARLGVDVVQDETFAARVLIETVRSAAPGSLYGVEGDSIVIRAREIYGEARSPSAWPVGVRLRLGLLPTLAIGPLEQMWGRRVLAPTPQESTGFLAPADLGGAAIVSLPMKLGEVALGVYNGEGFAQREQNEGKTTQARVWLTPFDTLLGGELSLKILGHYEDGSLGPAQSRADRAVAGLAAEHTLGAFGVDAALVDGVAGNSAQKARTSSAWVRVGPLQGVELVGRLDQVDPNRRANGATDRTTTWQGGVGYHATLKRPEQAFEVYLTYRNMSGGAIARTADPRLPQRGVRVDLKVAF